MGASSTEIANMALSHLGIGKEIANLVTEKSQEAAACKRYYDIALNSTLEAFNWPFARKFAVLALVQDNTAIVRDAAGSPEWNYYYRLPSDCLNVHRILSGQRNDSRQSRAPFLIVRDDAGLLIYCDEISAEIEYTATSDDPSVYPNDFTKAFTYHLAEMIAPRVTGGDNFQIGERAAKKFMQVIEMAKARALNSEQVPLEVESEFIRARGGSESGSWIDNARN